MRASNRVCSCVDVLVYYFLHHYFISLFVSWSVKRWMIGYIWRNELCLCVVVVAVAFSPRPDGGALQTILLWLC